MRLISNVMRVFDRANELLFVLAGVLVVAMFAAMLANIGGRLLRIPLLGLLDLISYCLLYFTFMAGAYLLKRDKHIRVELVLDYLKPGTRHLVDTLTSGLGTILWLVLTGYSAYIVWESIQLNLIYHTMLSAPRWALMLIIPIGSFLLSIESMRKTWGYTQSFLREKREKLPPGQVQPRRPTAFESD